MTEPPQAPAVVLSEGSTESLVAFADAPRPTGGAATETGQLRALEAGWDELLA